MNYGGFILDDAISGFSFPFDRVCVANYGRWQAVAILC
jgi:hypothetical protein